MRECGLERHLPSPSVVLESSPSTRVGSRQSRRTSEVAGIGPMPEGAQRPECLSSAKARAPKIRHPERSQRNPYYSRRADTRRFEAKNSLRTKDFKPDRSSKPRRDNAFPPSAVQCRPNVQHFVSTRSRPPAASSGRKPPYPRRPHITSYHIIPPHNGISRTPPPPSVAAVHDRREKRKRVATAPAVIARRLLGRNLGDVQPPEQSRPGRKPPQVAGIGPMPEGAPRPECLPAFCSGGGSAIFSPGQPPLQSSSESFERHGLGRRPRPISGRAPPAAAPRGAGLRTPRRRPPPPTARETQPAPQPSPRYAETP